MISELQQDEELMKEYEGINALDWMKWKDWKVDFEKIIPHEDYKGSAGKMDCQLGGVSAQVSSIM